MITEDKMNGEFTVGKTTLQVSDAYTHTIGDIDISVLKTTKGGSRKIKAQFTANSPAERQGGTVIVKKTSGGSGGNVGIPAELYDAAVRYANEICLGLPSWGSLAR